MATVLEARPPYNLYYHPDDARFGATYTPPDDKGADRAINRILRRAAHRFRKLPVTRRPADPHDVLTLNEGRALAMLGAWPLSRRQRGIVTGRGREADLKRLMRRLVRREQEKAIGPIVAAVREAMGHGKQTL